jgi:hypothetical protein
MAGDFTTIQEYITWTEVVGNLDKKLYTPDMDKEKINELDVRNDYNRITVNIDSGGIRSYLIKFGVVSYAVTELYEIAQDAFDAMGWT